MSREDAYQKYSDPSGKPRLTNSCVLFFDLLGISAMATSREAKAHLEDLIPALQAAADRAGTEDEERTHASSWFTDNVVIGTPTGKFPQDDEGALLFTAVDVSYMQLILLERGFLGRGGIASGLHFMNENFVFGPALIAAHDVEQSTKQPRIAVSSETQALIKKLAPESGYGEARHVPLVQCFASDEGDGQVFVDVFGVWLSEEDDLETAHHFLEIFRNRIESNLRRSDLNAEVIAKWVWLADYFNWSISRPGSRVSEFRTSLAPEEHKFSPFHSSILKFSIPSAPPFS